MSESARSLQTPVSADAQDSLALAGLFFASGSELVALPSWQQPRLIFERADAASRWRASAFYPAFRLNARLFKLALRSRAALGALGARTLPAGTYPLAEFIGQTPDALALLVGTPGPAQKLTARIWQGDKVKGYVKYGPSPAARARLGREAEVLSALPAGIGPEVLRHGALAGGAALYTAAVPGEALAARLPVDPDAVRFLAGLCKPNAPQYSIDTHPFVTGLRDRSERNISGWLEPLANRDWASVYHHGDFAPWNLLRDASGTLRAIDWEYGATSALPHLDLSYYVLQVAFLMERRPPEAARDAAQTQLIAADSTLKRGEALALVKLTALYAHLQARDDGHADSAPLQRWRQAVWEAS